MAYFLDCFCFWDIVVTTIDWVGMFFTKVSPEACGRACRLPSRQTPPHASGSDSWRRFLQQDKDSAASPDVAGVPAVPWLPLDVWGSRVFEGFGSESNLACSRAF